MPKMMRSFHLFLILQRHRIDLCMKVVTWKMEAPLLLVTSSTKKKLIRGLYYQLALQQKVCKNWRRIIRKR